MKNRRVLAPALLACLSAFAAGGGVRDRTAAAETTGARPSAPPAASLCAADEQVIFSCALKAPARLVSLCGSKTLTRDEGYVQYRFGRPGRVELEFPKDRAGSQKQFRYEHVFRYQFDLTDISFENGGFSYTLFDHFDGEQKPARREAGVTVRAAGENAKESTTRCAGRVTANYGDLTEILAGR